MKLGLTLPGIAFWRAWSGKGWDRWFWGLISVAVARNDKGQRDFFHWQFRIGPDFNFASGLDFDWLTLLLLNLGPFNIRLLFIDDLGGGYHDNGD